MRIRSILASPPSRHLPTPVLAIVVSLVGLVGLPMAAGSPSRPEAQETPAAVQAAVAEAPSAGARLTHPLPDGRLSMPWGPGRNPFTHAEFHHDGVDLAAPLGTPIRAAADGVVVKTVVDFGDSPRGRLVMLVHDGDLVTSYSHVEEVRVEPGQKVSQGDVIATVGSTGLSTGPHLHFEVRRIGEPTPLNPATVVDGL